MTHETKVGLLIGLGFIVVFAVLLSYTGSTPPTGVEANLSRRLGDQPSSISGWSSSASPENRLALPLSPSPGSGPSTRPALVEQPRPQVPRQNSRVGLSPLAEGLPMPPVLGPAPSVWLDQPVGRTLTGATDTPPVAAGEPRPPSLTVVDRRTAPPLPQRVSPSLEKPEPSSPGPVPAVSPAPADVRPQPTAPPRREVAPKEYIVQKGDTLGQIAKAHYGTASVKVVEFLAAANKANGLRDIHMVREGQKLTIPPLPPELAAQIESPVASIDVSRPGEGVRTVKSEDLPAALRSGPKPEGRKAPPTQATRREVPTLNVRPTAPGDSRSSGVAETRPTASPEASRSLAVSPAGTAESPRVPELAESRRTPSLRRAPSTAPPLIAVSQPPTAEVPSGSTSAGSATAAPGPAADGGGLSPRNPETGTTSRTTVVRQSTTRTVRFYEVRAGDTPSSIAASQLGSAQRWQEIMKLNEDLDPKKLRPGVKIKLPPSRPEPPATQRPAAGSRRASA